MKIFKINYNSIKSFFNSFAKVEPSKSRISVNHFEPVKDTFVKTENAELTEKLNNLNYGGVIYANLAEHLENLSPKQAKFLSGMIDKNNGKDLRKNFSPAALPIIKNCQTDKQFYLFKKYVTNPRVVSQSYAGAEFNDEIKLVGEIIDKMDEFPIVASALKRFLDDKKYLNTAFDRGLYKILYSMHEKEKVKYLNVILNDPKLYDNDMFLTNLFLTKDTKEIDKLIKKCQKGKNHVK